MKKTILLFVALLSISVTNAQEPNDYLPFIDEEKLWLVGDDMWVGPNRILTYYFDGDTLVGGHLCKKWWCNDVLLAPVFEENKKVWFFRKGEDEPRLLYDFSGVVSEEGFRVGCFEEDYDTNCYVDYAGVDEIHNSLRYVSVHDDFMLERLSPEELAWFDANKGDCGGSWTTMGYRWYEGIGLMYAPDLNVPHKRGEYRKILRVSVGERIIYEHPRASEILTAIQYLPTTINHQSSNHQWYDLSGRRVDGGLLPRGIYIRDGKKVVVK